MSSIHPIHQNIPKPKTSVYQKNTYFKQIMTIWGMKCLDPKSDSQNSNFCRPAYPLKAVLKTSFFLQILPTYPFIPGMYVF